MLKHYYQTRNRDGVGGVGGWGSGEGGRKSQITEVSTDYVLDIFYNPPAGWLFVTAFNSFVYPTTAATIEGLRSIWK